MTLRRRLLLILTVSALAGALVVAAASVALVRSLVRERFVDRIRSETSLLAEWSRDGPAGNAQEFATRAAARLGVRVTLIGGDGTVLADSSKDAEGVRAMDNHLGRPEIDQARLRGSGESFRTSDTTSVEYFYSARRTDGQGPAVYVRLALPSSEVYRLQSRYAWLVAAMVPGSLLLISAIGYAAVRRMSRPVEAMADAVERSARGELQLRLPPDGGEEIERLARAVSTMQQALLEKLDELGAERSLLSSVIEGVREGLMLVGSDRRIRLANEQLRQTLELRFDPRAHALTEVVRHPTVIEDIETAFARGDEVRESIFRLPSGRSFQLRITPIGRAADGTADSVLVLFFDVSRLEKLESVRREFVANVSHELRTPLTSIKAFVETLLDGGLEDRANAGKFLGIIRKHADRMDELIEDLTHLSLIETGAIALEISTLDASQLALGVVERLQPLAQRQGVRIHAEIPTSLRVRADPRRLEQMLTNLLENALKFSSRGGQVWIRGELRDDGPVIAVEDQGIGIATGSLEKIFHRFHQEHRDRSSRNRGTGLGLSIVKHLMRLHGGRVRVESELGRGSRFFLEFPRAADSPPPAPAAPGNQV